jgi:F-type H+-transporting ATPase subunit delta
MKISSVAKRYAQALYDYAVEGDAKDAVRSDCVAIRHLIDSAKGFSDFVEDPTVPQEAASKTVELLFKDKAHAVTLRFLEFLISKGRLNELQSICDAFEQHICEDLGILKVKITAAHELTDDQLTAMKQKLSDRYSKQIDAAVEVDAALIGGFKIQVKDYIQDFSIVTKLDQFKQKVINA